MANNGIKFLIAFFIVSTLFVTIPDAASVGNNKGLYSVNDKIEILTVNNFNEKLYGKPYVWLIEFYSSWCGHCQRFAPFWKTFANDIQHWGSVVKIGAIDCAQDENNPICRDFEIMAYPSLRFFHANYPSSTKETKHLGETFAANENTAVMREQLVQTLINEVNDGRETPSWPKHFNIPYLYSDLNNAFYMTPPTVQYTVFVIENRTSLLGHELILDTSSLTELAVKYVYTDNVDLINFLKHSVNIQIPSLIAVSSTNYQPISITPLEKTRKAFQNALKSFSVARNLMWLPETKNVVEGTDAEHAEEQRLLNQIKSYGDVLYLDDLESVIKYSLKQEISVSKTITGEKLIALQRYLTVLSKYFPFGRNGITLLQRLRDRVAGVDEISGESLLNFITQQEAELNPVYATPQKWIRCRGSTPTKRGYPCGLWSLFHYLTVNAVEINANNPNYDGQEILSTMLGYVKHFFGCSHCSQHFQEMAAKDNLLGVSNPNGSILWLWAAHNTVNKRLSGDVTEDPQFPKIQYPSRQQCPHCYRSDSSWNLGEVLRYLKTVYSNRNIRQFVSNIDGNIASASTGNSISTSWTFFSSFDVSICLVLYVSSAFLLTVIIKMFLKKRYKKKIYVHDLFGKV